MPSHPRNPLTICDAVIEWPRQMKIETLKEATEAAAALSEFLNKFFGTISGVPATGGAVAPLIRRPPPPPVPQVSKIAPPLPSRSKFEPSLTAPMILDVLGKAGRPLRGVEIVNALIAKGYHEPDRKKAYSMIVGAAAYMARQQKLTRDAEGGYSLPGK